MRTNILHWAACLALAWAVAGCGNSEQMPRLDMPGSFPNGKRPTPEQLEDFLRKEVEHIIQVGKTGKAFSDGTQWACTGCVVREKPEMTMMPCANPPCDVSNRADFENGLEALRLAFEARERGGKLEVVIPAGAATDTH
jgi:hypothetical protein